MIPYLFLKMKLDIHWRSDREELREAMIFRIAAAVLVNLKAGPTV